MRIDPRKIDLSKFDIQNDRDTRIYLASKSLYLFALFYFPHLFKFKTPDFHYDWYDWLAFDNHPDTGDFFTYLLLIGSRDTAKTSLMRIALVWYICFNKIKTCAYTCYEIESSKNALFDIAQWLQTNEYLIRDFGLLYYQDGKKRVDGVQKKTIGNFITNNGVKVFASSIRKTLRGENYDLGRPDCYMFDDIENLKTKVSPALTKKGIDFLKEAIPGMAGEAKVCFAVNYVTDTGIVRWLKDTARANPKSWVLSWMPMIKNGKSVWPQRFVMTDKQAEIINKYKDSPSQYVRSLETLKRTLNQDGEKIFEQEYLLEPEGEAEKFFNKQKEAIQARIAYLKSDEYKNSDDYHISELIGGSCFQKQIKKHASFIFGADVGEGFGGDSSVLCGFEYITGKQVYEFESNRIQTPEFGEHCAAVVKHFGNCRLAIERNSLGIAVINEAVKQGIKTALYRQKTIDTITQKPIHKYGWYTTQGSKHVMLDEFRTGFKRGEIQIFSIPLLEEMLTYTKADIYVKQEGGTSHYDRLMAACIAWQARKQVKNIYKYDTN